MHSRNPRHRTRRGVATLSTLAIGVISLITVPTAAHAVATDIDTAQGRAVGSGKWGYIGQFGKLNKSVEPAAGEFFLPYGIDIQGDQIAVTDSGFASWESGTKVPGHSVQTFELAASPGSAGHGDYLGGGQYDIVDDKSSQVDPADIVDSLALTYYAQGDARGPRGVAFDPLTNALVTSSHEGPTDAHLMRHYDDASLGVPSRTWGPYVEDMRQPGSLRLPVGVDTDSAGNVYVGHWNGVSVFNPAGELQSTLSWYFDHNGEDQRAAITWGNRETSVPEIYPRADFIGETYGLSVTEENGKTVVYVGDSGEYYDADGSVHFQNGSQAEGLKPASIKKYIVTPSGGPEHPSQNDRFNPELWKWELDTSFGTDGAVQFDDQTLLPFFGRYLFTAQTVFALEADPASGTLYYSLRGANGGTQIGTLSLDTGDPLTPIEAVNNPSNSHDSRMNYVRGIAVDDRGLVYATTQQSTGTSTDRAIVQIWGKTPTSIAGTAGATPGVTTTELTWGDSVVGYQQPDLLDYVVQYREVGATDWILVPAPGVSATSTETARTVTGLSPDTEYEALITPFNEAGSGDPAEITWRTGSPVTEIGVVKRGNGTIATSADDAVHVTADSTVTFTYDITNHGNVPVTDVTLEDDILGTITNVTNPATGFDGTIAPGATVTFEATGTIPAGAYVNTATATAASDHEDVTATTTWHGYGETITEPEPEPGPEPGPEPEPAPAPTPAPELSVTGATASVVLVTGALAFIAAGIVVILMVRRNRA